MNPALYSPFTKAVKCFIWIKRTSYWIIYSCFQATVTQIWSNHTDLTLKKQNLPILNSLAIILSVPPTFDFDCSIFSNEYLMWVKEKMSHFKLCFLGVLNPLGNLHIAWWGGAIQSISSSYLLDLKKKKKKKVNSSNSGQKIVACQAAELPGFHVTLETSTGAPASE